MAAPLIVESPIGALHLVAEDGALVGLYTEAQPYVIPRPSTAVLRTALRPNGEGVLQEPGLGADGDAALLQEAAGQLAAWFRGALRTFDLPLRPRGTPFQRAVWQELRRIPYGTTRTYGDVAAALGNPTASRAVGAANGRNPISIIVPCHRVIGATGALTGYAGGLARKRWLLDHERAVLAR
jgi:methylated-DNA-[protein]-cysteine S-methyltransferase